MSIAARLEDVLSGQPDRIILRSARQSWSRCELADLTRRLAEALIAAGVTADEIVEIHTDDHGEAAVLMVAVLRAGGGFCVVPPTYPAARTDQIRQRTRPAVIVESVADALQLGDGRPRVLPDRRPEQLSYVIFTSGSTGEPKAVEITDRGLEHLADLPGLYPGEVIAHAAALQFDACIYEILGGLLNGKTVQIVDLDDLLDRGRVGQALRGVDVLFLTTAVFNLLADRSPELFDDLELVLFGGERVSPRHVAKVLPRCRVMHMYGPTEMTVFATMHEVAEMPVGADVPIGHCLPESCAHVLDDAGQQVAQGQPGELVLGGRGLMRGYRDDPDSTERSMITVHGQPHYRTGDVVTSDSHGTYTFIGRQDRQVKVKGYRIDLAEIEHVAVEQVSGEGHPAGATAIVDRGLVRLFVTGCRDLAALRRHLRQVLPAYMVPVITPVGSIPLTANGKTDAAALIDHARRMTPAQERAREVFAGLVSAGNANSTFLDLGGDSLSAMNAVWQLDDEGVVVDMGDLLTRPLEEVLSDVA